MKSEGLKDNWERITFYQVIQYYLMPGPCALKLSQIPSEPHIYTLEQITCKLYLYFLSAELFDLVVAAQVQEGQEEPLHVQGQEGRQWGDTPHPR